jgi:hypothetical protein
MDVAAFQSMYPEEVRICIGQTSWFGDGLELYNADSGSWVSLADGGEAMMFNESTMNFETIDSLVKSSIVSSKEFVIVVDGDYIGFVRGNNITSEDEEEMDIEIDWGSGSESNNPEDFEAPDFFSPEEDLKKLM